MKSNPIKKGGRSREPTTYRCNLSDVTNV